MSAASRFQYPQRASVTYVVIPTTGLATLEHPLPLVACHGLVEQLLLGARVVEVMVDDLVAEQRARDRGELSLLEAALARELPVLAICRGFEVLNVARGGDIVQHLPEIVGHEEHREVLGEFSEHAVRVDPSSRIGEVRSPVMSHHHQGIDRIGEGLREVAWAEDGTVEGIEDPEKPFVVGVLWHPEAGEDQRLFEQLVEAARK